MHMLHLRDQVVSKLSVPPKITETDNLTIVILAG